MKAKIKYLVQISLNPPNPESLSSLPTFLGYGSPKNVKEGIVIPCDSLISFDSSLNQEASYTQGEVVKHENITSNFSPSSPIHLNADFKSNLVKDILSPSIVSHDPPMSHELIITISSNYQEGQVFNGVSGDQRIFYIFCDDYI